jgi:tetratricopeptide (TPR) repeat protein
MSYPGNSGLSVQAQERVMTAFKQVLTNLQAGQREEAMIGLEFVLRLDPNFAPAASLKRQLASSSNEIDLGDIIAQLQAPTTEAINGLLIEAVDDFNSREFLGAREKVEKVLIDLPGHPEARDLRDQIEKALKIESQVGQFLIQAREALTGGDPQEAANFVMMAQALDPHHTGIASTLKEIDDTGGLALSQASAVEPQQAAPGAEAPPTRPATTGAESEPLSVADDFDPGTPAPPIEDEPGSPLEDAFAVEFDSQDPFADLIDSEPEPAIADPAPEPSFGDGSGDDVSFPAMDDTADLFTAPSGSPGTGDPAAVVPGAGYGNDDFESVSADEVDEDSIASTIQELIEKGQVALNEHDPALAISLWSRVFLIKPTHPESGHLIERAKKALAEAENQIGSLLAKARDAFDEGELDAARLLITKALALRPNHLEVNLLREQLDREQGVSSSPPPAAETPAKSKKVASAGPELPELDDDLFGDLTMDSGTDVEAGDLDDDLFDESDDDFEDSEELSLIERLRSKLSVRLLAIVSVSLVVVLAGVWLGGKFLTDEPEVDVSIAVNEVLMEADRLYKQHKVEEALHLLREFPSAGLSQQRIDMRIAKYEVSLAPPTPTPVPEDASRAQGLLDQGLWWSAYMTSAKGLADYPDDTGLMEIHQKVIESEPEAPVLDNALKTRDYRTAVSISEDLLLQYPGQGDLVVVLERSLFNAALAESRAYNLTGAENHLTRLLELKPEDEEASRFLEFVQKYKVRAADMRLEIFIRSMNER